VRLKFVSQERVKIHMVDWDLAVKICIFGLSAVFGSLAILIAAIYAFGRIVQNIEKKASEKG
jgi:Na+-transporting methylmalonyl-CoA/oxaloacetate decarboxylase gamma subunit